MNAAMSAAPSSEPLLNIGESHPFHAMARADAVSNRAPAANTNKPIPFQAFLMVTPLNPWLQRSDAVVK